MKPSKKQIKNPAPLHLTLTAVLAALIAVFTAYIGHIPLPGNAGYLHFGDALIFLAACLLPRPYAMVAAAIGGGLADLLTFPIYTIPTVIIKALIIVGFSSKRLKITDWRNLLALLPAFVISAVGYFAAQLILWPGQAAWRGLLFTSFTGSLIQWGGSAVIFVALGFALDKTKIKKIIGNK
ncbi:MAG: TIGR04002 family protein [Oscillospiraceae bacterium]|jgi:uncharacterized repeat protein (TIGR04002 family)|nr:TIGR04002 family protein [Oscillospiraceae bacterium]